MKVGVLALQGAFYEHIKALNRLEVEAVEIRSLSDIIGIDRLVLPGGESTVQGKLLHKIVLFDTLRPDQQRHAYSRYLRRPHSSCFLFIE